MPDDERAPFGVSLTKRYTSPVAESVLYDTVKVRGHSEIQLVDYMGGPDMIERVATAGHGRDIFPEEPSQESFLRYLVANSILAPFRSVQLKFSIQAPISTALAFVYDPRASVNEYSGRYSVMLDSARLPSRAEIASHFPAGVPEVDKRVAEIESLLIEGRRDAAERYKGLLETDLARELARSGLGPNNDTRFVWKMDLVSLASFVKRQRNVTHPTSHTRECVDTIDEIARYVGGAAWDALIEYAAPDFPLNLTMPNDDFVVDGLLAPSPWEVSSTRRVCAPGLEEALFVSRQVLDHGLFQPVDYMGDDSAPAQAARTSYGQGTKQLQEDTKLIHSLARDAHTTPLEMAELAVESRVPFFSDPRQAGRHRTLAHHGFMGYFPLGSLFYFPSDEQFKYQDRKNRQGRGADMDETDRTRSKELLRATLEGQVRRAQVLRALGAPEEYIRDMKGVGFYTKTWRIGDAHNLTKFLGLRTDAHAQFEVRAFAHEVDHALALQIPITHEAAHTYMIDGMRLSTRDIHHFAASGLLLPSVNPSDVSAYVPLGLTLPIDKNDLSKGVKLTREGEALRTKVQRLRNP